MLTTSDKHHILVAGASGVIGSAAVEHFARTGWQVTALSRRRPIVDPACRFGHVAADLTDRGQCAAMLGALPPVSHLIYAAGAEVPGLVSGWSDAALIAQNGRMFANVLDALAASGKLAHVSLLQGAKAYGAHLHEAEVPAREDTPRDDHANFYWLQEDHVRRWAAGRGTAFTILRPQVLFGHAPGSAMNPVAAIGAYAALCRELGMPFAFPGAANAMFEAVDAGLLCKAFEWATSSKEAENQVFNITNGDVFAPRFAWARIGSALGFEPAVDAPCKLVALFANPDVQQAWRAIAARHGLRVNALGDLVGQSHHYADLLLGARIADKRLPLLLSTIKIRQAGFTSCRDSIASIIHWLGRMRELRLLPPLT